MFQIFTIDLLVANTGRQAVVLAFQIRGGKTQVDVHSNLLDKPVCSMPKRW